MTGKQFYDFICLPENKHRKFIPVDDQVVIDNARIWFEVSAETYKEWDQQRKRKARSHEANENVLSVFSLEDIICADSRQHTLTWQDILSDERRFYPPLAPISFLESTSTQVHAHNLKI